MFIRILYFGFRIYCFFFRPIRTGVRVMLLQGDQVLLIRQTYVPGWFMPGGGLKRGETMEQAARREAKEEAGAELADIQLMGVYTAFKDWKTDHNILFICREFTLNGEHDSEIAEVRFFHLIDLPDGLWPGHRRRIEEVRANKEYPQFGEW
jgi:8-oxo-dGTP pyrophosphatase MutT (NUDIX family)